MSERGQGCVVKIVRTASVVDELELGEYLDDLAEELAEVVRIVLVDHHINLVESLCRTVCQTKEVNDAEQEV